MDGFNFLTPVVLFKDKSEYFTHRNVVWDYALHIYSLFFASRSLG